MTTTCPWCNGSGLVDPNLPTGAERRRSRRTAQDTSEEAAAQLDPRSTRAVHIEILRVLRARRSELMHADMVLDSGFRRRTPDTNRRTIVWEITPLGRLALARATTV
jgi:hypothetical protein